LLFKVFDNADTNQSHVSIKHQAHERLQIRYVPIPEDTMIDKEIWRISACISLLWAVMKTDFFSRRTCFFYWIMKKIYHPNHTIWKFQNV